MNYLCINDSNGDGVARSWGSASGQKLTPSYDKIYFVVDSQPKKKPDKATLLSESLTWLQIGPYIEACRC